MWNRLWKGKDRWNGGLKGRRSDFFRAELRTLCWKYLKLSNNQLLCIRNRSENPENLRKGRDCRNSISSVQLEISRTASLVLQGGGDPLPGTGAPVQCPTAQKREHVDSCTSTRGQGHLNSRSSNCLGLILSDGTSKLLTAWV